jgi:MoaA/NifB/PqqE/SkfB family radical SAM enzyme
VNFNFLARCNMHCPFCYCPFDGKHHETDKWHAVVDRLADWQVDSVVFGGGDPFNRAEAFMDLLKHARQRLPRAFLQVDTNLGGIRPADLTSLTTLIDLLGVPLDGPDPVVHGQMRADTKHFELVVGSLRELHGGQLAVKVNTVVAKPNISSVQDIGSLLVSSCSAVRIWSLYEFWPIGTAALANKTSMALKPGQFDHAMESLIAKAYPFAVEQGQIDKRRGSYFFVSQGGAAYATSIADESKYTELGSIFDDDVIARWHACADPSLARDRWVKRKLVVDDHRSR